LGCTVVSTLIRSKLEGRTTPLSSPAWMVAASSPPPWASTQPQQPASDPLPEIKLPKSHAGFETASILDKARVDHSRPIF
jgi:hypothetical protein